MKRKSENQFALHTRCAERIRAMQLICMCASNICARFSQNVCVRNDMDTRLKMSTLEKDYSAQWIDLKIPWKVRRYFYDSFKAKSNKRVGKDSRR